MMVTVPSYNCDAGADAGDKLFEIQIDEGGKINQNVTILRKTYASWSGVCLSVGALGVGIINGQGIRRPVCPRRRREPDSCCTSDDA